VKNVVICDQVRLILARAKLILSQTYVNPSMLYLNRESKVKLEYLDVSPPTWSRRSTGSGGESSSMLTSVEGNAVLGRMLL
jgi:hypothetical protein